MPHYYFHIKAGAELIKDDEGSKHATLDRARSQALKTARELWADAIKSGKSLEADAIVIADEQGQLTFVPCMTFFQSVPKPQQELRRRTCNLPSSAASLPWGGRSRASSPLP